jgi:L-lactate dehydrogenase (cytochrome)
MRFNLASSGRVDEIDTTVSLFGRKLDVPFFIAHTGMSRLFHHTKENAVTCAAAKFGMLYSLSTLGTVSLEEITEETDKPKMFQIYILRGTNPRVCEVARPQTMTPYVSL